MPLSQVMPEAGTATGDAHNATPQAVGISGLWIVGAQWDAARSCLTANADSSGACALPPVTLEPCCEDSSTGHSTCLSCPVLPAASCAADGGLGTGGECLGIMDLPLPSAADRDEWLLRGVTLFCETP